MMFVEHAVFFACGGESLAGIIACPGRETRAEKRIGVLIIVGGAQYRVGSHRQFVLLARRLAGAGVPCMRFDMRGMGDSTGVPRSFEATGEDIRAALDAFHAAVPELAGVALWGLCDGASAAVLHAGADPRVAGLMLLNPWVHTETGAARTRLRHYYARRLFSPAFWRKLAAGGVDCARAASELWRTLRRARRGANAGTPAAGEDGNLPERVLAALRALSIPWWVMLSGNDHVAREFERAAGAPDWAELLRRHPPHRLPAADHTFSRALWRDEVAQWTLACLHALSA
jgi:exosortase A-associated hydrolase 1